MYVLHEGSVCTVQKKTLQLKGRLYKTLLVPRCVSGIVQTHVISIATVNVIKSDECVRMWSKELCSVRKWLRWDVPGGKVSVSRIFSALCQNHSDHLKTIRMRGRVHGIDKFLQCILANDDPSHISAGTNYYMHLNRVANTRNNWKT